MTCCSAPPPRTLLTIAADPRLLDEIRAGTSVEPSTMTAAEYLRGWLDTDSSLSPKTVERYRQLAEQQIIPHLGVTLLQKLRPAQIHDWHASY